MTDQAPEIEQQAEPIEKAHDPLDVGYSVSAVYKSRQGSFQLAENAGGIGAIGGDVALEPPIDPEQLWSLTEVNPFHAACIRAKATDACGRGWSVYRDDEVDAEASEAARDMLDDLATGGWTFGRLWLHTETEFDAIGYGIVEVTRDDQGRINGLFPSPAQTFRVAKIAVNEDGETDTSGNYGSIWCQKRGDRIRYFVSYTPNREQQPVISMHTGRPLEDEADESRASELLVTLFPTPRSTHYGLPDWIAASGAISELSSIRAYNEAFFESGGMIDQVIHVRAGNADRAKEIKQEIVKAFQEAKGRQHVNVFVSSDNDVEIAIKPLSQKVRSGDTDSGFSEGKTENIKEVLMAHQVPPYRIGWAELGSLGGSAAKEMLDAYRFGVIEPRQNIFESTIAWLLEDETFRDLRLEGAEVRFEDVDWDAFEHELEMANEGVDRGALNRDEWRRAMGFEPTGLPEMQEYLIEGKPIGGIEESMMETFQQELRTLGGLTGGEEMDEDTGPE